MKRTLQRVEGALSTLDGSEDSVIRHGSDELVYRSAVTPPEPPAGGTRPPRGSSFRPGSQLARYEAPRVYPDVRAQIRTGDVLLFRGRGPLSAFIQWGSESPYSHAGIAARWEDRVLVFQATGLGATFVSLSAAVDAYDGAVDWFVPTPEVREKLDTAQMINAAVNLLGRRYARAQVVNLMWRVARQKWRGGPDSHAQPEALFCSQYVSYCYRLGGHDLVPGIDDASTSPGDLARSKDLVRCGTLRADPAEKAERRSSLPGKPRLRLK